MELNNMETLELAEPEAMPKKKKNKKRNKKKENKKNKKGKNKKNKKGKNKKNNKGRNKKKNSKEGRSGPRANSACATNINKYLFYLAKALGNLSACSANIQKACSTGLPKAPNDTELAACKT